jgi:hypothetical protein
MKRTIILGLAIAGLLASTSAYAETQGMDRRDERRDTRDEARDVKQDCKAGDESRAECRQEKRDTKQDARHGEDTHGSTGENAQPQN